MVDTHCIAFTTNMKTWSAKDLICALLGISKERSAAYISTAELKVGHINKRRWILARLKLGKKLGTIGIEIRLFWICIERSSNQFWAFYKWATAVFVDPCYIYYIWKYWSKVIVAFCAYMSRLLIFILTKKTFMPKMNLLCKFQWCQFHMPYSRPYDLKN